MVKKKSVKQQIKETLIKGWSGYCIQPFFDDDDNLLGHRYAPRIKGKFIINGTILKDGVDPYNNKKVSK